MKKVSSVVLSLIVACAAFTTAGAEEVQKGAVYEVAVGQMADGDLHLSTMVPNIVYVHEGDSVTFTNKDALAPHTVTFLAGEAPLSPENPASAAPTDASGVAWDGTRLLNSGMLLPGQSYTVTFNSAGAYSYYCVLHPDMKGVVVVVPKGQPIPSKAEQKAAVNQAIHNYKQHAQALRAMHDEARYVRNSDGSLTYAVRAGVAADGIMFNRYAPDAIVINEGDSVEWINDTHEGHMVVFNKPDDFAALVDGQMNMAAMAPAGGPTFDGKGFVSSGLLFHSSYKLTFTKAGVYEYQDPIFAGLGMTGKVVVLPKGTPKVVVNGEPLAFDGKLPRFHQGELVAAIAPFIKALGGDVQWNDALSAVVANVGGAHELPSGLKKGKRIHVVVNGKVLGPDEGTVVSIDGVSYASPEDIVRLLGGSYAWDGGSQTFYANVGLDHANASVAHADHANAGVDHAK